MFASITRLFCNITQQPGFIKNQDSNAIKNTHDSNPTQTNIEFECDSVSWQPGLIRSNQDLSSIKILIDVVTSNSKNNPQQSIQFECYSVSWQPGSIKNNQDLKLHKKYT
jgi:hypothetical protein